MKDFSVRIVSKDIINGEPLATCAVTTHDNRYFANVIYNFFTNACKTIDIIDLADIQLLFGIKTSVEYDTLITSMYDSVFDTILKEIMSNYFLKQFNKTQKSLQIGVIFVVLFCCYFLSIFFTFFYW